MPNWLRRRWINNQADTKQNYRNVNGLKAIPEVNIGFERIPIVA